MWLKLFRRGSARWLGILCGVFTFLLCLYYVTMMGKPAAGRQPADATLNGGDAAAQFQRRR